MLICRREGRRARHAKYDIIPADTDPRTAGLIVRWFGILEFKGWPLPPESHMPDLVRWIAAQRPDLTHYNDGMAMRAAAHWDETATKWSALNAPLNGIVRLNENRALGQAVGAELDQDFKEIAAWRRQTMDYAVFGCFRQGLPIWTASVEPLEAQTPEEAVIIFDGRGDRNQPVDSPSFDRAFGHAWLGADSWGEHLPPKLAPLATWGLSRGTREAIWRWAHSTQQDLRGTTAAQALDLMERRKRRQKLAGADWD
jgi:hypothetical protein